MTIGMSKARSKPAVDMPHASARGHILVVEDEQDLQDLLVYNLTREGFAVTATDSGEQALKIAGRQLPDLMVLDLMLPGIDGLEVCRTLKSDPGTSKVPIVMLTAKGEEADVVVGLEMGADDYITKPFSPRVLIARLRAVLRRPVTGAEGGDDSLRPLKVGRIGVHPDRHEVTVDGEPVQLTATEFKLLHLIARRPGRVFTRQQIIDGLHDGLSAVTDRSVDVQIVSLRRKLGGAGANIETVRGVGYRLKED
jgi:two-component system phosphate regulon response regulator PhoB